MRVVTLDKTQFDKVCKSLEGLVQAYSPDLIVGIATGGVEVADRICREIPHCQVNCHRVSSEIKSNHDGIFKVIRRLPMCVRNLLRMAEALLLRKNSASVEPYIPVESLVKIEKSNRVLLVDDAIDSGHTMQQVLSTIKEVKGKRDVKTAVITVTTKKPLVTPDYSIYNDLTLIRFPWAKDA